MINRSWQITQYSKFGHNLQAPLQAFKDVATNQPGLHVEACKCLDRCKQGPNIRVEQPGGVGEVLTSRPKPVKKDKQTLLVPL